MQIILMQIAIPIANRFNKWRGDLMQISAIVPEGYKIISCCFADMWERAQYCYYKFGADDEDYILDQNKKRYKAVGLALYNNKPGPLRYIKVKREGNKVNFQAVIVDEDVCGA